MSKVARDLVKSAVLAAATVLTVAIVFSTPPAYGDSETDAKGTGTQTVYPGEQGIGEEQTLDGALELIEAAQEYRMKGDEQRSIEALDQAYASLLEVNVNGDTKLVQPKEDLRFTVAKRLMEIHASRRIAAKGKHRAIPLTMNAYVEREIRLFQGKERRFFLESWRRSGRYRATIVNALSDAGLPEELSWLPLIESGFKPKAKSPARALGLWQFVPSTAYKYGLARNTWIDERLDPGKATKAAIAYLTDLHEIFGDWATVLAAYNCGEGTVLRAINRQKREYLDDFWDLYERLPYETARYFPRFLAVLTILKDPARYGFSLGETDTPLHYEEITVDRSFSLGTIAKKIGVSGKDLVDLNPELRRHATPDSRYCLKVPSGKSALLAELTMQQGTSSSTRPYVLHNVANGETLSDIALRYHASVKAIMQVNDISKGEETRLRLGRKLKIPLEDVSS